MTQRSRTQSFAGFFALVAFFSVFGLVVGGFMFRDAARDRSTAADTPQAITLAELLTHGAGDNAHVIVSRFEIGRDYVVYIKRSEKLTFLILRPRDPVPKDAQQIMMVENRYLKDASDVAAFCSAETITGIYSNWFNSTDRESRRLLEEKYPGLDFWNAPFLEVRQFRGDWYYQRAVLITEVSGAIFLSCVVGAIVCTWIARRNNRRACSESP